ncbi:MULTISPECIES: CHASE domain-containing protein [unclassified Sphingobium]|uniref:CHASE domain-containing protein n=1 Tax=unclassified Sphingobium TaxID=2611147 RepID=UPI002224751F|nr:MULTISPECIES: CHASE domain-containing protein [unclassified Sphingobium]MCW2411650.1 two-component sensor histidine kinase [Sphingobium sp. B8D3D]MCW2416057.1 two-component sensor histidine kinase [Sphingobium sp. B8D3A]
MVNWDIGKRAKRRFDSWLREYPRATPIGVFLFSLTLVGASAWSVEVASERTRRAAAVMQAGEIVAALQRQAAASSAYFQATSALFLSADGVSPEFFRDFISRLRQDYDFTGVVAIGWARHTTAAELPELTSRMREAGYENFAVNPAPAQSRQPMYIITIVEPNSLANRRVLGFDIHSDARRAAAIDRALRTRSMAATDPVKLKIDENADHNTGIVVLLPVAQNDEGPVNGFIYGAIRVEEFIRAAVKPSLLETGRIEIFDTTPDGQERIFAAGDSERVERPLEQRFSLFDQQWSVRFYPAGEHWLYPLTLVVLVGGVSFSMLLLAYILLVQRRNEDLVALVNAQAEREAERAAFVRELNHRVKNSLSNVTSIIALTRRNATDINSFADNLMERVRALAASHSLLDGAQWGPTDLKALIETQLGSHGHARGRIVSDGPNVLISPNDALSIGLALHELLTNATRYGALSADQGEVHLHWSVGDEKISVSWEERGGPPVVEPVKRGFGLNLIERALAHELGTPIRIDFLSSGLMCTFDIPLRKPKSFQLRRKDGAA